MAGATIEDRIAGLDAAVEGLCQLVRRLPQERFLGRLGGWSPRDIVAHLVGWNRHVVLGSEQIQRGELPFYDVDPGEDYSKVNSQLIRDIATTDRAQLLDQLSASADELAEFLRTIDPADWKRDFGVRHQGAPVTIAGTVDELIADYAHHRRQIEEWTGAADKGRETSA